MSSGDEGSVSVLSAAWPAPPAVRACTSLRAGGYSSGPYRGLNLAAHVGDDAAAVESNRRALAATLTLPAQPLWLDQVHGTRVVDAAAAAPGVTADAAVAHRSGVVCAVLTADCLPILLCDTAGTRVAAAHAGWRGLAGGVVAAAVAAMETPPAGLMAWLGPAIGQRCYEVGDELRQAFPASAGAGAGTAWRAAGPGKWYADLYALARLILHTHGVTRVYGGGHCTFTEADRFYSYRRDGATGRMATLIWLEST